MSQSLHRLLTLTQRTTVKSLHISIKADVAHLGAAATHNTICESPHTWVYCHFHLIYIADNRINCNL